MSDCTRYLKHDPLPWLMEGEPWIRYRALVDILDGRLDDAEVRRVREETLEHPVVASIVDELRATGPTSRSLEDCYNPEEPIWKLWLLANMGLLWTDLGLPDDFWNTLFELQSREDAGFRFSPGDRRALTCLSANTVYTLFCLGFMGDARLDRAYHQLLLTQGSDGGWHCDNLPGEEGLSREAESCPFATVNVLQAFSVHPYIRYTGHPDAGVDFLLSHYERRGEPYRPEGWGIGSDWHKLCFPHANYGMLKFADVLSCFRAAHADPRFHQLLHSLSEKQDEGGRFTAESVYPGLEKRGLADLGKPSRWITLIAFRTLKRTPLLPRQSL